MKAREYFERMSLSELVQWYNDNVAIGSYLKFADVMEFNQDNLAKVIEYCGEDEYTAIVFESVRQKTMKEMYPEWFAFDTEVGLIYSFDSAESFLDMALETMIEEFENQQLDNEDYE